MRRPQNFVILIFKPVPTITQYGAMQDLEKRWHFGIKLPNYINTIKMYGPYLQMWTIILDCSQLIHWQTLLEGYYSSGKRQPRGTISHFLCGIQDGDIFRSFCRVGSGVSQKDLYDLGIWFISIAQNYLKFFANFV